MTAQDFIFGLLLMQTTGFICGVFYSLYFHWPKWEDATGAGRE